MNEFVHAMSVTHRFRWLQSICHAENEIDVSYLEELLSTK